MNPSVQYEFSYLFHISLGDGGVCMYTVYVFHRVSLPSWIVMVIATEVEELRRVRRQIRFLVERCLESV